MNLSFANKIWRTKNIFSGLTARNTLAYSALAPAKRTFSKSNSEVLGYLRTGSTITLYSDKVDKESNDAVLVKERLIAVADGIGGWNDFEIDVGKYSRRLIRTVGEIYEENSNATPKQILLEANYRIEGERWN
jgi:hypothetical protein